MSDFYVPKRQVTSKARVIGDGAEHTWELYLSETAQNHAGPEVPSDLLNQEVRFIAVKDADAGFLIVNRRRVLFVDVPADEEFHAAGLGVEDLAAAVSKAVDVELLLQNGERLRGTLVYIQPPGQQRLQDYMNVAPDFIALRDGATAHIVNRREVVWLTFKEERGAADSALDSKLEAIETIFDSDE